MFTELSVCSWSCCETTRFQPMSPTIVFIAPAERRQVCLYVCVCVRLHACVHVCVGTRQIPRMQLLFVTFLVCVEKRAGKPNLQGSVGCTCCSPQPIQAGSDRKLGGLGSKLLLVREENAAFVSFCVCVRMCTVTVCVRECLWGRGQLGCDGILMRY